MTRGSHARILFGFCAILASVSGCSKSSTPTPTVTSVTVTGDAPAPGGSSQFSAVARLSDGSTPIVTTQAAWQTSNPQIATVTNSGAVTGVSGGTVDISAIYQQVRGNLTVTVSTGFCINTVQPVQITIATSGGPSSVAVVFSQGACSWTAQSNASFITITNGASGNGSGTVSFTVAANNTGAPRTGTLTIAGATVTVNQG